MKKTLTLFLLFSSSCVFSNTIIIKNNRRKMPHEFKLVVKRDSFMQTEIPFQISVNPGNEISENKYKCLRSASVSIGKNKWKPISFNPEDGCAKIIEISISDRDLEGAENDAEPAGIRIAVTR